MDLKGVLSMLLSREGLISRPMLWTLFWVNLLGTIYGYEWYWNQIVETAAEKSDWLLPFVPDSPTASLFFTISVAFLLLDSRRRSETGRIFRFCRGWIEALAVVTSVKYGIWAVVMIVAGAVKGSPVNWQDWMLSISHLGMAAEAVLFVRFFKIRPIHIFLTVCWVFANDYVDYHLDVFPWLPNVLYADLPLIQMFTVHLSIASVLVCCIFYIFSRPDRV